MGWGGAGEGVGGAVRLLEPVRWDVREGVGHRGRAESWASSGKRGMDTLSISGQCGTMVQE